MAHLGLYNPCDSDIAQTNLGVDLAMLPLDLLGPSPAKSKAIPEAAKAIEKLPDVETLLKKHLADAIDKLAKNGLTRRQSARVATNPELESAFRGERIDTFFKVFVGADTRLNHLNLTPRFKFGPDIYDPVKKIWYDVTREGQWQDHLNRYERLFGEGIGLFYR